MSNTKLVMNLLYPDSGHGFLFQYHTLFGQHATLFLER